MCVLFGGEILSVAFHCSSGTSSRQVSPGRRKQVLPRTSQPPKKNVHGNRTGRRASNQGIMFPDWGKKVSMHNYRSLEENGN